MLKNRAGLRIAVLVNDVADVNVDAQLIRRAAVDESGVEMVELENGCVCCGPGAGGLAPAVLTLANRVDESGAAAFDHVVVEMSGVADPTNVESNLNAGGVAVERKVALVDANAFPAMYNSVEEMGERIDLAGPSLNADPCAVDRRVVELLLVQIETADVILINKCDLASEEERRITISACRALNDKAEIVSTTYGDAAVSAILPLNGATVTVCDEPGCTDPSHDHSHAHEHSHASDDAHSHSHEHSHGGGGCDDPACTDPSHDHSHDAATCTDPTHDHSHDSSHAHSHNGDGCTDALCTDPSHDHSHTEVPNSADSMGFQTYIYRARRPFVQDRLVQLVRAWPLPTKDVLALEDLPSPGAKSLDRMREEGRAKGASETFANVLRSKGTCWLDQQHRLMAQWSHAGYVARGAARNDTLGRGCLAAIS